MTTKCGIKGIKNIKKTANIADKMYCSKDCDETAKKDGKNVKSK